MGKVLTFDGKYADESDFDFSQANPNCKDCYGRGWTTIYDKTIKRKLICRCVARKNLSSTKKGRLA